MKQKSFLLCPFFFLITLCPTQAQKHTILRAGLNIANVTITNDGDIDKANSLTSYQVGILADMKVIPMVSVQTGLLFTGKGSKTQSGNTTDNNYYRASSNPMYLELPLTLILKSPTGLLKFFGGAGPYVAMGISGRNTVDGKFLGTAFHSDKDIKWSNDDPSTLNYEEGSGYGILKRFDYGLNGTAGIETRFIVLSINYGLGLAKLQSGTNSQADDKNKNRVLSFTAGLRL